MVSRGNKREQILEAATAVFSEKGYHNTTIEEVAQRTGVGKGTVYDYFDSKLQLFQSMLEQNMEAYRQQLSIQEMQGGLKVAERIYSLLEGHLRFCIENRHITGIIFSDNLNDPELKAWGLKKRKEKEDALETAIAQGMAAGEIRPGEARLMAMMILGILGSLAHPIIFSGMNPDPEYVAREVTDYIIRGIGA